MYREIACNTVPLTRSLAEDFATSPGWDGERALSPHRLRYLRREYDAGRFHAPRWCKAYMSGRVYRGNGQHSSRMLAELNGTFPAGMMVTIKEVLCVTPDDLVALLLRQ